MIRALIVVVAGCHGTPSTATPSNTGPSTADFCTAMKSNKDTAIDAMHAALVASGASEKADATAELTSWLHAQACVLSVEPDAAVVETKPAIRTIKLVVKVGDNTNNACTAELTLAPGAKLAMTCTTLIDI